MTILKGPKGICQATRNPAKIYPYCMCQKNAVADEWYCQEHLDERNAERESLLKAAKESAHIDGRDDAPTSP